jgi:hypothetical protein
MKIEDTLRNKGHDVVTITETRSVLAAARALVDHRESRGSARRDEKEAD